MRISSFVNWELDKLREECNFTEEELKVFNHRAKDHTIERVAEEMNLSESTINRICRRISIKIGKVL